VLQELVKDRPNVGFSLILQLTGIHGNQQFDRLTKTKTVESILASMDLDGIKSYIVHLLGQVNSADAYVALQVLFVHNIEFFTA
jgi:DNA polymerase phi